VDRRKKLADDTERGEIAPIEDPLMAMLKSISSKIDDVTGRLTTVEERVERQAKATPQFQPSGSTDWHNGVKALKKAGEGTDGKSTLPVGVDGLLVHHYRRRYADGDIVQLDPASDVSKRLADSGVHTENLLGQVVGIHFVNNAGKAKYRVNVPGVTGERGDGFWEDELIPA
jgi:hypothetical protein